MNPESFRGSHPEVVAAQSAGRALRAAGASVGSSVVVDMLKLDSVIRVAEATSELYSGPAEFLPESARTARRVAALGNPALTLTCANVNPSFDGAQLFADYQARQQEPYDIGPDCE